jgi:hypothetical protein
MSGFQQSLCGLYKKREAPEGVHCVMPMVGLELATGYIDIGVSLDIIKTGVME